MPTITADANMGYEELNDLLTRHSKCLKPTIQEQVDAAMREQHLRQTREPVPNQAGIGQRLSGETIHHILRAEEEGNYPAASTHGGGAIRHAIVALTLLLLASPAHAVGRDSAHRDVPLRLTHNQHGETVIRNEGSPTREDIRAANQWLCLLGKTMPVGVDCKTIANATGKIGGGK